MPKEFEEILLLAGNGYGNGANKLLRSFFERVVTFAYLAERQEKIQQFIDYSPVHWHKLLEENKAGGQDVPLEDENIKTIEKDYETAKEEYSEDVCKPCGKKRVQ